MGYAPCRIPQKHFPHYANPDWLVIATPALELWAQMKILKRKLNGSITSLLLEGAPPPSQTADRLRNSVTSPRMRSAVRRRRLCQAARGPHEPTFESGRRLHRDVTLRSETQVGFPHDVSLGSTNYNAGIPASVCRDTPSLFWQSFHSGSGRICSALLRKGAISPVPTEQRDSGFYSRYFLIPKQGGGGLRTSRS
ncbi:hypothetical protein GOODEAATRI_001019 [Goodea atripinnis]|uniref:Uncharacterized protein n=1 Tax=Goodea atripinnis TaxID=208336 RepID=A0ABV0NI30_9TELE